MKIPVPLCHHQHLVWVRSNSSVGKESACNAGNLCSIPGSGRPSWKRDRLPIPVFLSFPKGLAAKESACNTGDLDSIPGLGRSPREGNGNPLQYSCLENLMDTGAWWAAAHGVAKSQARLTD